MKNSVQFEHGGDIYSLSEELKIQERKIIDFSSSINPLGISKKVKAEIRRQLKYLHNYPDPEARRLRRYLALYHGIDPETVLCGNGSTELIYLIVRALKPERVLIPAPTFSEYERACKTAGYGVQVTSYKLKKEDNFDINPDEFIAVMSPSSLTSSSAPHHIRGVGQGTPDSPQVGEERGLCNMAFLCNPNNPTGRLLGKNDILKIAEVARKLKCYLVVDEAFIDFCPEDSVIDFVKDNPYLIVLRSLTKFYALSGLRVGYGVFPLQIIEKLKEFKEPWTVNSLAQRAAVIALKDKVYRRETFSLIEKEKGFLEKSFKKTGIEFFPSQTNFYLLSIDGSKEIYNRLKKKGILVRECSNFRGLDDTYIRIAVKSHRENKILIKEMAETLQQRG